jgi:hypothetical protein
MQKAAMQNTRPFGVACLLVCMSACGEVSDVAPSAPRGVAAGAFTCAYPEVAGGLYGYCTAPAPDRLVVDLYDGELTFIDSIAWQQRATDSFAVGCEQLCEAGALQVAERAPRALDTRRTALALETAVVTDEPIADRGDEVLEVDVGGCQPLTANAADSYKYCLSDVVMDCVGACGVGCRACEIYEVGPVVDGTLKQQAYCATLALKCYTRPCCQEHDDCLAAATDAAEEAFCHLQAAAHGCGLDDAAGATADEPDASCKVFVEDVHGLPTAKVKPDYSADW